MGWVKQLLWQNWGLKLLSLALAYALWAVVTQTPPVEMAVSVPLELRNLPPELRVAGGSSPRVHLRLRGPESQLRKLPPDAVAIGVDLSGISAGNHWFLLDRRDAEVPPGIEVVGVTPDQVRLELVPR